MKQRKDQNISIEIEKRALRSLLDKVNEFYENPANRQAYEAWEKSEEGKKYVTTYGNI